ncbi:alpha/beta hydrolase [Sorangium sp. So ce834]|uniref:alpha/beta hydrolase family protein n=1 Tax=Sorangium sp. So ce834 TaxID=3133321 RepID=UPI003F62A771
MAGGNGGSGGGFTGTCTESRPTDRRVSGSGPHQVVVETNSDPRINEGTIFRPADLGGGAKYPIFVWGQGGCSRDGLSTEAAMAEIASHGYFVVADGTPGGKEPNRDLGGGGDVLLAYVDWVIAENEKPCSAYYHSIETTKVAANGFSCGGLMAAGTAADPRMTTWGHTSSGTFSPDQAFYKSIHTPVLIVTGTADSLGANENGARDYQNIAALGDIPVMMFAKVGADHGGDLWARNGGEFTQVNLAWLNWWLKGDVSATGKGMLVGASCRFCSDRSWNISSANLP